MPTSPADTIHAVNSFIAHRSCNGPEPGAFFAIGPAATSSVNPAVLGPDRGALASNPGRGGRSQQSTVVACDRRLSGACVIEKNLAWSDLGQRYCLNCGRKPRTGIATIDG